MLHQLSDDGFRRFSLARPQTARMMLKLRGDLLTAAGSPSHKTNPQAHTYLYKNPALSLLLPCSSIISYGEPSDASAGFTTDGIPNMFGSFCLLFRLWRSVKEFRRLSGVFRCHSGLLFLQSCRKNVHSYFPSSLKFYYK